MTTETNATIDTSVTRAMEIARLNVEREAEIALAHKRNNHPTFVQLFSDENHAAVWTLRGIELVTLTISGTPTLVYVGQLKSSVMNCRVGEKGYISNKGIQPMSFWYNPVTSKVGTFNTIDMTSDRRDMVKMYVPSLMKHHLKGKEMIEAGSYISCKGFNNIRNRDQFGEFVKKFMNITDKKVKATYQNMETVEETIDKALDF